MEHQGHEKWYSKLFRILNSAFCFASAYMVVCYLHWVTIASVSRVFDFNAFIYYYGCKFILNGHRWSRLNVVCIHGSGPIAAAIFGLLCIYFFTRLKRFRILLNLFLIWGFVVGIAVLLSQSIISSIGIKAYFTPFYTAWSQAFAWAGIPPLLVYALNVPFLVLLLYFAVNITRPFLLLAYSYTKVNKLARRRKFFVETALVPFVIGAIIVLVITFPVSGTSHSQNIAIHGIYMLVIAVMLFIGWYALQYVEVMKDDILKYKSLQSFDAFSLILLAIVAAYIKLTWHGIYL